MTEETDSGSKSLNITDTTLKNEKASEETLPEELFILDPNKKVPFKILIPKIGVEWIVHEGTSIASLKRGPGHYMGLLFQEKLVYVLLLATELLMEHLLTGSISLKLEMKLFCRQQKMNILHILSQGKLK